MGKLFEAFGVPFRAHRSGDAHHVLAHQPPPANEGLGCPCIPCLSGRLIGLVRKMAPSFALDDRYGSIEHVFRSCAHQEAGPLQEVSAPIVLLQPGLLNSG